LAALPTSIGAEVKSLHVDHHPKLNHEELFRISSTLSGDFLMTYDNVKEVRKLVHKFGFDPETVARKMLIMPK